MAITMKLTSTVIDIGNTVEYRNKVFLVLYFLLTVLESAMVTTKNHDQFERSKL